MSGPYTRDGGVRRALSQFGPGGAFRPVCAVRRLLVQWLVSQRNKHTPSPAVVQRNIRTLLDLRRDLAARRSRGQRLSDRVTAFCGSIPFVCMHAGLVISWIVINLGLIPGLEPFDPFPFVMLAMIASVEAIFLSTFVLISQNRANELAEKRGELDLHVNLLAEHEITRLVHLVEGIALRLGTTSADDPQLEELKRDLKPDALLRELEGAEEVEPPR